MVVRNNPGAAIAASAWHSTEVIGWLRFSRRACHFIDAIAVRFLRGKVFASCLSPNFGEFFGVHFRWRCAPASALRWLWWPDKSWTQNGLLIFDGLLCRCAVHHAHSGSLTPAAGTPAAAAYASSCC